MNAKERSDFTQGSILKKMIPFMMPILGALILQAAYGAVDLLVVGRFGTTAGLSAVSTGSQILNLVTFVITQLAMGITVLIARYIGEKHTSQIGELLGGATTVFTMIAVVLFVVMVFFAKPLAVLMQAPQEALMLTSVYVRICGGGIFFIVAYNVLSAIFRGLGDSRSPLIFVMVACVVNVVGDLVLVAGFHLDAAGAAIATVLAQAVSVVLALLMLKRRQLPFKITKKDFLWLFEDDISNCRLIPDTDSIKGQEVRNQFDFDATKMPEVNAISVPEDAQVSVYDKDTVAHYLALNGDNPSDSDIFDILMNKEQIVLTGVPGVGKSRYTKTLTESGKFADSLTIQFHANYSYEDFIGAEVLRSEDGGTYVTTKQ